MNRYVQGFLKGFYQWRLDRKESQIKNLKNRIGMAHDYLGDDPFLGAEILRLKGINDAKDYIKKATERLRVLDLDRGLLLSDLELLTHSP